MTVNTNSLLIQYRNKMASVASLTPIASSRFLSPKATPGNKPILSPATVSLSNVKTRQSSKSIAVTPPYRSNFDYSNIREETEKVMESIGASEVQVEVPAPEPLPIHAPSLDQRQQFLRQQQDAEKAAASSSFPRYYPSPVTEANAPMTLTEQLINRGRGGIVRTTDALSALNLSDVGAIDDWIENLKSVLGRHLYDVMMRLNQSCQAIVRELTSRNVNSSDVQAIERVLTFQSER